MNSVAACGDAHSRSNADASQVIPRAGGDAAETADAWPDTSDADTGDASVALEEDAASEVDAAAAPSAFALKFGAVADGVPVGCSDVVSGLGPEGKHSIGVSDLRFYVSNLKFLGADGNDVAHTLDSDEFQYQADAGSVSLVDLTGNTEGACAANAIAFAEGTGRTHLAITGTTLVEQVTAVSFDVGVPQPLMKQIVANNTIEGAPSPLNEMYWSWASGYRHFVANLTVKVGAETGDGYLHVGSMGCGPMDGLALEDRAACDFVNTPRVAFANFDLLNNRVDVDVRRLVSGMNFVADVWQQNASTGEWEIVGQQPGVACHSMPDQPDCGQLFPHIGLDVATGAADATKNSIFVKN